MSTIAALLALLVAVFASSTAAAADEKAGQAFGMLAVSAVVLERCQVSHAAAVTVACRRGVVWEVKAPDMTERANPAEPGKVREIYF